MSMKFSWFPGHMRSALRALEEETKSASLGLVVLDARCPRSTRNPHLEAIFKGKPLIYVLNKSDLAATSITKKWVSHFCDEGLTALQFSCRTNSGKKKLFQIIEAQKEIYEEKRAGRRLANFRIVLMGLPNTGKSSIINELSPIKSAKTGKKPGLTRGKQWLRIKAGIEVLDTPGIMVPRMDLEDTPWILGLIAAIKQEILPVEEVALHFVRFMMEHEFFPQEMLKGAPCSTPLEVIQHIAISRGFLKKGNEADLEKTSLHLLKIFREGKFGRISLEAP